MSFFYRITEKPEEPGLLKADEMIRGILKRKDEELQAAQKNYDEIIKKVRKAREAEAAAAATGDAKKRGAALFELEGAEKFLSEAEARFSAADEDAENPRITESEYREVVTEFYAAFDIVENSIRKQLLEIQTTLKAARDRYDKALNSIHLMELAVDKMTGRRGFGDDGISFMFPTATNHHFASLQPFFARDIETNSSWLIGFTEQKKLDDKKKSEG